MAENAKTTWVCGACGKRAAGRDKFHDTSCMTWAVECWTSSLKFNAAGMVCGGTAITMPEPASADTPALGEYTPEVTGPATDKTNA